MTLIFVTALGCVYIKKKSPASGYNMTVNSVRRCLLCTNVFQKAKNAKESIITPLTGFITGINVTF